MSDGRGRWQRDAPFPAGTQDLPGSDAGCADVGGERLTVPAVPVELATPASGAPGSRPCMPARSAVSSEDDFMAVLLIVAWTLSTGRVLRSDIPPWQLSEEELIAFWADDRMAVTDSKRSSCRPATQTGRCA